MAVRCYTFERRPDEARAARCDALAAIAHATSATLPDAYARSVRRTLALVSRSVLPPA